MFLCRHRCVAGQTEGSPSWKLTKALVSRDFTEACLVDQLPIGWNSIFSFPLWRSAGWYQQFHPMVGLSDLTCPHPKTLRDVPTPPPVISSISYQAWCKGPAINEKGVPIKKFQVDQSHLPGAKDKCQSSLGIRPSSSQHRSRSSSYSVDMVLISKA